MLDLWGLVFSLWWAQHFKNFAPVCQKVRKTLGKLVYKRIHKGGNYSKEERNKRQETIQGNTVSIKG